MSAPGHWTVFERDEVGSTQDEVRELLRQGLTPPLAVRAETQAAGRGRRGHRWESPRGGLWLSVALSVPPPADPFLGLLAAAAALDSVAETLPGGARERLALRWPNDLVIRGRKWGGVIGEVEAGNGTELRLVLGIGLNLRVPADELPRTDPPALPTTSILAEFGQSPSPALTLPRILSHLDTRLAADRSEGGRGQSLAALCAMLETLGRPVRWREGDRRGEGVATGLAPDGGLEVEVLGPPGTAPAPRRILRAAEIEHLRDRDEE